MIICSLIINKYKNVGICVYMNDVSVSSWKLLGWSDDIRVSCGGGSEELAKRGVFFDCFVVFCMLP